MAIPVEIKDLKAGYRIFALYFKALGFLLVSEKIYRDSLNRYGEGGPENVEGSRVSAELFSNFDGNPVWLYHEVRLVGVFGEEIRALNALNDHLSDYNSILSTVENLSKVLSR